MSEGHRNIRVGNAVVLLLLSVGGCVEIRMPDPSVRYVAFGDSSTAGTDGRAYPEILRELLGEPEGTFANEGRGGETTAEGLERIQDLLLADLFPNAEIWLYWEGGNDVVDFVQEFDQELQFSPDENDYPLAVEWTAQLAGTHANIKSAIDTLHAAGKTVFVATLVPVESETTACPPLGRTLLSPEQADVANVLISQLNEVIREAATDESAIAVDTALAGDELRSDPANYADCNHLSELGNEIVANVFFEVVRQEIPASQ